MFCSDCGAENKDSAAFCRKCGALVDEAETRVAGRRVVPVKLAETPIVASRELDKPEAESLAERDRVEHKDDVIFSITPTLKFVMAGYVTAAVIAVLLVGLLSAFVQIIPTWVVILVSFSLLLIPAFYHLKQKLRRYTLTESTLEIDEGIISRFTRSLPVGRIQDVTVSATIPQRLLGLGDLSVDNASDDGSRVTLKNIDSPKRYADLLLRQMRGL